MPDRRCGLTGHDGCDTSMRNYATLCDARYLAQALALYESLKKHSSEPFTLFILPMDNECANILAAMVLPNVQMVLGFHESHPGMKEARANRTHQEYCWTCASNLCEALMLTGLQEITYLDADLMFFADPKIIFDEIGGNSIGIIPHRFHERDRQRLEPNGIFNVSWVTFRNSVIGCKCLTLWARQCRNWCYYLNRDGKFGDQKFLDEWPLLYGDEVCAIRNIGAGTAPWNIANYTIRDGPHFLNTNPNLTKDEPIVLKWEPAVFVDETPLVFYHFHEFRDNNDGTYRLTNWPLRSEDKTLIYAPYVRAVESAKFRLHKLAIAREAIQI